MPGTKSRAATSNPKTGKNTPQVVNIRKQLTQTVVQLIMAQSQHKQISYFRLPVFKGKGLARHAYKKAGTLLLATLIAFTFPLSSHAQLNDRINKTILSVADSTDLTSDTVSKALKASGSPQIYVPKAIHYNKEEIHSDFVLAARRASFKKYLMEKTIKETFSGPLNQYTDYKFENACLSATQFLIKNQYTQRGFEKMFEQYFRLDPSARFALLTAVYGIYPVTFKDKIKEILPYERDPKLFAIAALYDYRIDTSITNRNRLMRQMEKQFAGSSQNVLLRQLSSYLLRHLADQITPTPSVIELFRYQQLWKQKTIYSFQRWDRNYSGLCIVQYEDGHFARDQNGKLKIFRQLARSGSGLPSFITNGNTPQGLYRIAGSRVSIDKLIGPTPTLQSIIPFQSDSVFFRGLPYDSTGTKLDNYKILLPPSWQSYPPMQQSFWAGAAGRRYIVIHGSTLDGSFFEDWSFYPNAPTDGCLSTMESWDTATGALDKSDQLDLVNTYHKTPGGLGLLEVINLDNQKKNVSVEEINALVEKFEASK